MKNIKFILILCFFFLGSNIIDAQTFLPQWNNNYSGWLGNWYISNYDNYVRGNFVIGNNNSDKDFYDLLSFNPQAGWAMLLGASGGYFVNQWHNGGNGFIGSWGINSDDKYVTLYNSKHKLLAINSRTRWSQLLEFINVQYSYWNTNWSNGGNGWIGGWYMSDDDRYYDGNFDYQYPDHELLCVNTRSGWINIQKYYGGNFVGVYSNGGSGNFAGWIMRNDDTFFTADLNGDGQTELIAVNTSSKCAGVYKMINGSLNCIWYNNCNSQVGLGGWINFNGTRIITYDFKNDGCEEIMFVNPYNLWCTIKKFDVSQQYWPDIFCNSGNGWIDGWHISVTDKYIGGNFTAYNNSFRNLLFINPSNSLANLTRYNNRSARDNINISEDIVDVFPNPFNMNTKISFNLQQDGNVRICIFDILGREIKLINNSNLRKGNHSFIWNGVDNNNNLVCSGNYFLRIIANNSVTVKKLVVNK